MADFTGNLDMLLNLQRMEQESEPIRIDRTQSVRSKEKTAGKSKTQPGIAEEQDGITYDKMGRQIKSVSSKFYLFFYSDAFHSNYFMNKFCNLKLNLHCYHELFINLLCS
jgi:hypothetical protein